MSRPPGTLDILCHPDRPRLARGLCSACYYRNRRGLPGRLAPIRRYNYVPPVTERLGGLPPKQTTVEHHAAFRFPLAACRHCGNPRLTYTGREAHCAGTQGGCGATIYLVQGEETR